MPVKPPGVGSAGHTSTAELVVLLDGVGQAIGTAPKADVHHGATPLHLAFSTYVFDDLGRVLVTRRALTKATFPGVWTNSVCGHPAPGERLVDAVRRRADTELGLVLDEVRLVLPGFAYWAIMDGIAENEVCPVFAAWATRPTLAPCAAEVDSVQWVDWPRFSAEVLGGSREVSRWCREQVVLLDAISADPRTWPAADEHDLPPGARVSESGPERP